MSKTNNTYLREISDNTASGGGGGGGSATAANQATQITAEQAILAKIIAAPATSAKQDTQITAEQAILAKIIAAPATEAKQDTQITAEQAILAKIIAAPATAANQATELIDLGGVTETAPATDTASSGLNGRLQRVAQRITSLIALLPVALGGTTSANSLPVVLSSDGPFATQTGSITETAPATDTASSGLNGRLQRIAQRLTSLITALGTPFQAGGFIGNTTFASTQSGTWTVQPGNTANTTAWKVDGSAVVQPTIGFTAIAGGSFVRPSDTNVYASGDLVANSTTAGSVVPITVAAGRVNDGTGMVRRVRLTTSSTGVTNKSFRVHFYKTTPTVTNGDNGVWLSTESTYLGACDVTIDKAFSDGAKGVGAPNAGSEINFAPSSGTQNIFALIEARAAYTPTSAETITLACEVLQN